jgi:hypothetical protein
MQRRKKIRRIPKQRRKFIIYRERRAVISITSVLFYDALIISIVLPNGREPG